MWNAFRQKMNLTTANLLPKLPEIADKLSKHITLIPLQEIHSHAADGDS